MLGCFLSHSSQQRFFTSSAKTLFRDQLGIFQQIQYQDHYHLVKGIVKETEHYLQHYSLPVIQSLRQMVQSDVLFANKFFWTSAFSELDQIRLAHVQYETVWDTDPITNCAMDFVLYFWFLYLVYFFNYKCKWKYRYWCRYQWLGYQKLKYRYWTRSVKSGFGASLLRTLGLFNTYYSIFECWHNTLFTTI